MALRINTAARQRLSAMQRELFLTRQFAGMEQQVLADLLGVSSRTVRDWERCYAVPSMPNLIGWAYTFGFRLVITVPGAGPVLPPVCLAPGESFVEHEVRRLAVPLKKRREDRELSQSDLGLIVGVSRSSLQRWEDGLQFPIVLSLVAWADRLGCRVDLVPDGSRESSPVLYVDEARVLQESAT